MAEVEAADVGKLVTSGAAKKLSFQKERGVNGYEHFQIRVSFGAKLRLAQAVAKFKSIVGYHAHATITSGAACKGDFYVTKEDTRIEGPWSEKDFERVYVLSLIHI